MKKEKENYKILKRAFSFSGVYRVRYYNQDHNLCEVVASVSDGAASSAAERLAHNIKSGSVAEVRLWDAASKDYLQIYLAEELSVDLLFAAKKAGERGRAETTFKDTAKN